jgi:nicotinate-nucleotide adenylyltransferase
MSRIALYGGSFNPPHRGHLDVLKWLIDDCPQDLTEVWVLPTVNHAFAKELESYEVREELVQAMIHDMLKERPWGAPAVDEHIKVVRREEVYTAELLDNLEAEYPGIEFVPVIGADIINAAPDWHRWDDVVARKPIVVARKGVECETDLEVYEVAAAEVSSTSVRERLASGTLTYLIGKGADLPKQVMDIIEGKNLYGWLKPVQHKSKSTVDTVFIPVSELAEFKPGQQFSLVGDIRHVLAVHAQNAEKNGKVQYCIAFTVVRNPTVINDLQSRLRDWYKAQTEARHFGNDFDIPMPKAMSPGICYLNSGEAEDGDVGDYLGMADGLYFFKSKTLSFGSLFGF